MRAISVLLNLPCIVRIIHKGIYLNAARHFEGELGGEGRKCRGREQRKGVFLELDISMRLLREDA